MVLDNILFGFSQALTVQNIIFCMIGALLGTLVGVLPGIGSNNTIALLLPTIFYLPFPSSVLMLISIYYGAQYGGSTSAILTKVAGEISSIPTIMEGHLLANKGKAGIALSAAAISSFIAGIINTILLCVFVSFMSELFLKIGPAEFVVLGVLSMSSSILLSDNNDKIIAIGILLSGFLLSLIGFDITTGDKRFTFGILELYDGLGIAVISIGLFGLSELFKRIVNRENNQNYKIHTLYLTKKEYKKVLPAAIRGTILGTIIGLVPNSSFLSSFASYIVEKSINKKEFGTGAIQGVAGPEAANNAGSQSTLLPVFMLGIPVNTSTALILGSLAINGFTPGTQFVSQIDSLFWIIIASMVIGNILLLILNMPLIRMWVKFLSIPHKYINCIILLTCCTGVYCLNGSLFEIFILFLFGLLGYSLFLHGLDAVPFITGFVLGQLVEDQLKRALAISKGNIDIFFSDVNVCIIAIFSIVLIIHNYLNKKE